MTDQTVTESHEQLLQRVAEAMPIAADLSRADALLYRLEAPQRARIIAQAWPHSVPPIWPEGISGAIAALDERDPLTRALQRQGPVTAPATLVHANAVRTVYPVTTTAGTPIGLLAFDRTLIQHERQSHRKPAFRYAIRLLQHMVARGELAGTGALTPFRQEDGILVVDSRHQIQYASGLAASLYSRIGFMWPLAGLFLDQLQMRDAELATRAMSEAVCVEEPEERAEGRYWVKKAIPLIGQREPLGTWRRFVQMPGAERTIVGAILTVHDATEERSRQQQLQLKTDMLLELQHRVRNSLQTITALLRMQARRAQSAETRLALDESINRILSVAAVHEFLFDPNERRVNLRALSERLVELLRPLVPPPLAVDFRVEGADVFIAGERATPAALVIAELILNAVEHAFAGQAQGAIWVRIGQRDGHVEVEVRDNGRGAPDGFAPDLGLGLVSTLTREGLQGSFTISNDSAGGAVARVLFMPHPPPGNGAS